MFILFHYLKFIHFRVFANCRAGSFLHYLKKEFKISLFYFNVFATHSTFLTGLLTLLAHEMATLQ